MLVRGDNDATLVLGADPGATMPQPAIEHLARTPTIMLDPKVTHTSRLSRVHIHDGGLGRQRAGHRVSHGRNPHAAPPGAEVAVSAPTRKWSIMIVAAMAKKPGVASRGYRGDGGDRLAR